MPEVVREHPDAGWAGFFYPTHPPPPEPNITNASNATVFFWSAEPNATNASNATVPSPAGKQARLRTYVWPDRSESQHKMPTICIDNRKLRLLF